MPKDKNGYVKRFNVEKKHKDFVNTVNYDPRDQCQPHKRIGEDSFANMPTEAKYMTVSRSHDRRSGVINSFACGIEEESGIEENGLAE
jgi:hypothetical protein